MQQQRTHKDDLRNKQSFSANKVILGMTGVALTAGAVAAGAALMNPKTRRGLGKRVADAAKKINQAREYFGENNEVYSHQIASKGRKRGKPGKITVKPGGKLSSRR